MNYSEQIIKKCEIMAKNEFDKLDEIALYNQKKVLDAFKKNRVSAMHFNPSSGYGYDDIGRDTLNKVFSDVFHTEASIVSPLIANGTHALTLALFGLLRPGDVMVSIAGKPYDTLDDVINGTGNGSLRDFGINYKQVELTDSGKFDYGSIRRVLESNRIKLVFIQRSKGYAWREALTVEEIGEVISFVKSIDSNIIAMVDNCYGEFVEKNEPTDVGADVVVGSLIKNIGGGLAPTGGYISGKNALIEQISYRLTAPSLGLEVGSYLNGYLYFYEGLFLAPSTVRNALKGNVLAGYVMQTFGYESMPAVGAMPTDIIKSIKFDTADEMVSFIQTIQCLSPVDSFVVPEPWDMPGYNHKVVMAAGTFVQGASLELTADGAVRPPFVAYLQGGLTYEHYKLALMDIIEYFNKTKC